MSEKIALVLYYHKKNKYSFNALIGALEVEDIIKEVQLYFISNKDKLVQELENIILNHQKVILAISFFTTQLWEINGLVRTLKKRYRNELFLIAGGPHPTGDPRGTLKIGFDLVVLGEGEEILIELLEKMFYNEDYKKVKGIGFIKSDGSYDYTGKRMPIDLNKYPPFPINNNKFGAIEITRGCPYACHFCQTSHIMGTRPRHRDIDTICKYIELMKERNLTDIRFISPNAFSYGSLDGKSLNLAKLEELLRKIKDIIAPHGRIFLGTFPSEVRPEHVTIETLNLITTYANNDNITIGAQSGSQKILNSCHRAHTVQDIRRAVDLTIKSGIKANVDFIFGLPNETEKDILLTIEMMQELAKLGAKIHSHSFIPLPMTTFSKEPAGRINEMIQNTIKELTSKGHAFGDWRKQERIAVKIAKYLRTKKLK